MKRSEINRAIRAAETLMTDLRTALPPFCLFTPEDWRVKGREYDEIRRNLLGWDVTDFGSGDFARTGLVSVSLRGGAAGNRKQDGRLYTEKLLCLLAGQSTPPHYHRAKTEDLVNRGGGVLRLRVCNLGADGAEDGSSNVLVHMDGRSCLVRAGSEVVLRPGMGLSIRPCVVHTLSADPYGGPVLIGEISQFNDDRCDNFYIPPLNGGGDSAPEEDEPPYRLLCREYPAAPQGGKR
jgi:D-lyxose ketol-isomerase